MIIAGHALTGLYYLYILYRGDFGGGFSGDGIMIDNTSGIFGISGRVGLLLLPVPKISITVSSSCRFGTGTIDRVYQGGREKSNSAALTALHLGLGYNF